MPDVSDTQGMLGGVALAVSALNAWLIYRGSDRASARAAKTQEKADAATGFQQLTQEQRTELNDLRARVRESEDSARAAKMAAVQAEEIAEKCRDAYRELWEWASLPCPHPGGPPRPPIQII